MDDFLPRHPVKTRKPRARTQDLVSFSLNDVTADSEFRRSAMTPLAPRASGGARSVYTGGGAALWELPRFPSPSPAEPETRLLRTLNISTMRVCVKKKLKRKERQRFRFFLNLQKWKEFYISFESDNRDEPSSSQ